MPLSPLLLEGLAESGDIGGWQERQAKHQSALLDLQEKQRAIADAQRLRDLYASNPNPSFGATAAIDPQFAAQMQKFNNEQLLQQFNMLKAQGDIEETKRKGKEAKQHTFANTLGVGVENWLDSLGGKQPTQQDIEAFKPKLGSLLKFIDETYGYTPDVPIDPYHPEQILSTAESLGYASRRAKTAQESQIEAMKTGYGIQQKQAPSFSDRYFTGPDGLIYPNPYYKPGGEQPVESKVKPYPVFELDGKTYEGPEFMRMTIGEKDPIKKQRMEAIMDAGFKQQQEGTLTDPNAVKMPPTRQELAIEEETGKERAKIKVQDEQDAENKLSTIASMPSDEDLMKYLNDATVGKGEEILKGPVASFFHIENKAQAADTVLGVLQENIKNIATKAKGDMNMQEVKNYESAVGALNNKDLGPQARFQAYLAAKNMVIKKIAMKHPEIAKKYGMGTATQAGNQQSQIPEPKTVEEARKLPKGTVFKVPGTGQLKIVD